MDPSTEKQVLIDRQRERMIVRYPSLWNKTISEWKSPGPEDRAWLMYSANYLFRTQGVRWAIDPLRLINRLPSAVEMDVAHDLMDLDFVLLTHRHIDHLDIGLLRLLQDLPILWVIPEAILPLVQKQVSLTAEQILVPKAGLPFELNGLWITPFDGLHWEDAPDFPDGRRGVPATGYLVEVNGKRWLFPGDTRTFDPNSLPAFSRLDVLFAHLWLGRAAALQTYPPLLDDFCHFCLALQPHRIILTHLEEWGRTASDFWDSGHAERVVSVFNTLAPFLQVEVAGMGDSILLG
jgi:L-ascorbate metabolism protein UlaG (beta-lactamase superfamily)